MAKTVTAKGGVLDGKRFTVHESAEVLDPHPGSPAGRYVVKGQQAVWTPNKKTGAVATVEPGVVEVEAG